MSSTTQSHIQTGPQTSFNFNPPQRLTQINARPDVMRQPAITQMVAMNSQPQFIPDRQQSEQHGQVPVGMLSSNTNPSPNLHGGGLQSNNNPAHVQSIQQMQQPGMHQANQQLRRQEMSAQAHNAQAISPSGGGTSGLHLGPNQMAISGFPGNMQHPNNPSQVRRAQSQPQSMNQSLGQMLMGSGGMHPSQQGSGPIGMGMNPQPAQSRQMIHQQPMGPRIYPQMQGPPMTPEMVMAMRQSGNPMPQNMQRPTSQPQIMASLPQPPSLTQAHQVGMQPLQSGNFHSHSQTMSPSPRLSTRSQPQTPANMNLANPGPQLNASRSQSDIFNFQNQQYSQAISNNAPFPFVPSSVSPPSHTGEMSQSMGAINNTSGSGNRGSFHLTPAQQLQSGEGFNNYNMLPPQSAVPPRPPSNNNLLLSLQQQQQPLQSSQQQEQPQRPQSQPQAQPRRPPSQSELSNTPRTTNSQLSGQVSTGRIPPLSQQAQPGGPQTLHSLPSSASHPLPIAPRPPQPASVGLSSTTSANFPPSESSSQGQPSGIQRPGNIGYPLGLGQGLTRLLQFSGMLATENKPKLSLDYWDSLVQEYFAPQSVLKFTLWKDNQRNEAKPFDIGVPILPRFFLVTTQSGVKSMTLSLDGARERLVSHHHAVIECITAAWTCKYTNGYTVTLRGPLTAHIVLVQQNTHGQGAPSQYSLKFKNLEFTANFHDKSISVDSISIMDHGNSESSSPKTPRTRNASTPTANGSAIQTKVEDDKKWEEPRVIYDHVSIPGEPVNAFGIPQATMRCLELAESVGQMADLIQFSNQAGTGPIQGLSLYAAKIRDLHSLGQGGVNATINGSNSFQNSHASSSVTATPAVTLYSSAPPSANLPSDSQPQGPSTGPPQNAPSVSNSPQKQHKTIPQPTGPSSTSGQASGSGSAPSGSSMTPSMSNASLKRKQTDTTSPTTGTEPQKRSTRSKRGRATTDRGG